jgi:hypothetical protein
MPDVFKSEKPQESQKLDLHESSHVTPSEVELKKLPGHTRNPLASYCYYPTHVTFSHADEQEKIVLLVRKHPITNIPWITAAFFMLLAPLALDAVPLLSFLPTNFQTIAILIWYLITIAFVFEQFLTWYFNVNIITDERIFDVDFVNLLYRKITDADLDQIQDVTVQVGSAIRTIFNYGDVLIQTAAEVPELEFEAVPYPDQIAKIIRDLRVEEEVEKMEGRVR